MPTRMIVTIDGPAGTGKSTVARQLARRLGFAFLDTGAMYRGIAASCLSQGIDPSDSSEVANLARHADVQFDDGRTLVNGTDVTDQLRTAATTEAASVVAQNVDVRTALVHLQRRWADGKDVVSEGRDQGTVAFPNAQCKFFLNAQPEERARRRQQELASKGEQVSLAQLLAEQTARDERDATRPIAPLRAADDAIVIDTTTLTLDDVIEQLEAHIRSRQKS